MHGVLKKNIRQAVQRINDVQCTTLGACGDVERNVLCCPAPFNDSIRDLLQEDGQRIFFTSSAKDDGLSRDLAARLRIGSRTTLRRGSNGHEIEPIYGKSYLPRKFKIAIALAEDNCIDVYTNDLGFLAI